MRGADRGHRARTARGLFRQGVLLVFDVKNRESFEHVKPWVQQVKDVCGARGGVGGGLWRAA